jgi:site-specific recombinase
VILSVDVISALSFRMPKLYVVDSSFLRTEELAAFFRADPQNKALLTEEASMEAHKGDSLQTLAKSLAILSQFRSQVVVLKKRGN